MKNRPYPSFTVSEKGEKALKNGHLWVYGEELSEMSHDCEKAAIDTENGFITDIFGKKGNYLGSGFYNGNSKIAVRLLSRNANDRFDDAFWQRRVQYAINYRLRVMGACDFECCRLIFGEADGFPGLTVDRFGDTLVSEVCSLGIQRVIAVIYAALVDSLRSLGCTVNVIYERNESELRTLEGMTKYKGFYNGIDSLKPDSDGIAYITENGIKYKVDYINGQKTGFFLDQKYNRLSIRHISQGAKVLDVCTHTGAFALNASRGGAAGVTALDISEAALLSAKENAALNGIDNIEFVKSDMFDYLEEIVSSGQKRFDFIILDPPAFTKSGDTVNNAYRGYLRLNTLAMRALPRGGYLATCSCSHFMRDTYFKTMLNEASKAAGVQLVQIESRLQAYDHPILWNMPETEYLKFFIFHIV